jgi:hypothetical protein
VILSAIFPFVPTSQTSQKTSHHQSVGLKGSTIADHDGKNPKRSQCHERHGQPFATTNQAKEPPTPQNHRNRRDPSSGRFQIEPNGRSDGNHELSVDRRFDEEQIRERSGVELRKKEPIASLQIPGNHRRRDLSPHVILDDRLIRMDRPDRKNRSQ